MWLYVQTNMFYSYEDCVAWSFTSLIGLCFDSVFEMFPLWSLWKCLRLVNVDDQQSQNKKMWRGSAQFHKPINLVLRRLRQEDWEFEFSLGYDGDPVSQTNKTNNVCQILTTQTHRPGIRQSMNSL